MRSFDGTREKIVVNGRFLLAKNFFFGRVLHGYLYVLYKITLIDFGRY